MLKDPAYELILLDELNIALKYQYIDINDVVDSLQQRPPMQHVIITGRAARPELIDIADTVTEMNEVKHAFKSGIRHFATKQLDGSNSVIIRGNDVRDGVRVAIGINDSNNRGKATAY